VSYRGTLKEGDKVQHIHAHDGTLMSGAPIGEIVTIVKISDHNSVDGPVESRAIAYLSDGTWEFLWNLYEV
jgi:hypothetical protein